MAQRLGPLQLSARTGVAASTTHRGNIPGGGGWRFVGRSSGQKNSASTVPERRQGKNHGPLLGHAFVHTVIDDHTRIAYSEVHDDETTQIATGVWARSVTGYAQRGITLERVLSNNEGCNRSGHWHATCGQQTGALSTRPRRPLVLPGPRSDRGRAGLRWQSG